MTLKRYITLTFIYAIYSICNLHIANCEGLTDVYDFSTSKIDKLIGWGLVLGALTILYMYTGTTAEPPIAPIINLPHEPIVAPLPNDSINKIYKSDSLFWLYLETLQRTQN